MKKFIAILLICVMVAAVCGCAAEGTQGETP